jgi:hypothetical protein
VTVTLNGWTAARLDDLAADVAEIKHEIAKMRNEELGDLKKELDAAKRAPRDKLTAYLIPLIGAAIPTLAILLHHA